jgi:hypothetical protein
MMAPETAATCGRLAITPPQLGGSDSFDRTVLVVARLSARQHHRKDDPHVRRFLLTASLRAWAGATVVALRTRASDS